jgi:hypothetical protein
MSSMKQDEKQRLELLKLQKELERKQREQAMWRKASSLPKPGSATPEQLGGREYPGDLPKPPKQITGLFAKLKLGKFLE